MRKGRDGEKKTGKKNGKKNGKKKKENTDENSGHYVVASSRPPERRPLERRTLAPKKVRQPWSWPKKGSAIKIWRKLKDEDKSLCCFVQFALFIRTEHWIPWLNSTKASNWRAHLIRDSQYVCPKTNSKMKIKISSDKNQVKIRSSTVNGNWLQRWTFMPECFALGM